MKPENEELLVANAKVQELERLQGFSLLALYKLHQDLTSKVLAIAGELHDVRVVQRQHGERLDALEDEGPLLPARVPHTYSGPVWTSDLPPDRIPSDRAASISMSAPFGGHVGFKGRAPVRFAMALLLAALLAVGVAGYELRGSTSVHAGDVGK